MNRSSRREEAHYFQFTSCVRVVGVFINRKSHIVNSIRASLPRLLQTIEFQVRCFSFSPFPFAFILTAWNCPPQKFVRPFRPRWPRTSAVATPQRLPPCPKPRPPG